MNSVETALMNSPVRAALQRHYEAPLLERLGGRSAGGQALEVGCGPLLLREVARHALQRGSYRTFLHHPDHDRFSGSEFVAAVVGAGFDASADRWVERFFGDFVIGVATRGGAG
ncbi:MAG TPA: hypothetical protein VHD87_16420 [Acidimicrobiales bacterium]|nr:hypothetical protein [Acidimicrobiales bacterium]